MVDWGLYRFSSLSLLLSFLSYYGLMDVVGVPLPFSSFPIYGYGMVGLVWHFQYFLFIWPAECSFFPSGRKRVMPDAVLIPYFIAPGWGAVYRWYRDLFRDGTEELGVIDRYTMIHFLHLNFYSC